MDVLLAIILFLASARPVATATVTAACNVADGRAAVHAWQVAAEIAGNIAANVTEAPLASKGQPGICGKAPMGNATQIHAPAQDLEPLQHAESADRPESKGRTTPTPGVDTVGTTETLMRREVALISGDGGEDERAHTRSGVLNSQEIDDTGYWHCLELELPGDSCGRRTRLRHYSHLHTLNFL